MLPAEVDRPLRGRSTSGATVSACSDPKRGRKFGKMTSAVATQFLPVVAAARATKDYLIVSVHDGAPSTKPIPATIVTDLSRTDISRCSILVIPSHHHR